MRPLPVLALVLCASILSACGTGTADRTATGTTIGAATGAAVGSLFFGIGAVPGALIGGGLGAGVGAASDEEDFNLGRPVYKWGSDN